MDHNKEESVREKVGEKIKGSRKSAWGRLERDRVVNTRVEKASRNKVQNCWNSMERLESEEKCAGMESKVQSEQRSKK